MQYIHHDLGHRQRGEIVEVSLSGSAANVRLMDSSNLSNYKNGRRHTYHGGLAKRSPVRLAIPSSGRWHVTVDMQGLRGNVRSSARVLPGPLPTFSERPLADVPSLFREPENFPTAQSRDGTIYDVFISHASEDKDEVVRPLAAALESGGLRVWYDEFTLKIGDSLRQKIDAGLASSRFGIVVLSNDFIKKGWTNYELDGIVSRSVNGEQVMLPIWHGITKQQVLDYSPSLADKVARNTASYTLKEIADEIINLIQEHQ